MPSKYIKKGYPKKRPPLLPKPNTPEAKRFHCVTKRNVLTIISEDLYYSLKEENRVSYKNLAEAITKELDFLPIASKKTILKTLESYGMEDALEMFCIDYIVFMQLRKRRIKMQVTDLCKE